jgi:hypothetical protein
VVGLVSTTRIPLVHPRFVILEEAISVLTDFAYQPIPETPKKVAQKFGRNLFAGYRADREHISRGYPPYPLTRVVGILAEVKMLQQSVLEITGCQGSGLLCNGLAYPCPLSESSPPQFQSRSCQRQRTDNSTVRYYQLVGH